MAKVEGKGRDLVVQMLDAIEQLRGVTGRHENEILRLAARTDDMAARMNDMAARMNDMSARMDALAAQAQFVGTAMVSMSDDMVAQAHDLKRLSEGYAETQTHLGRLARLLGAHAERSNDRLDDLDARVKRLEKKSA